MSQDTYILPEMLDEDIDFQTTRPGLWRDGSSNVLLPFPVGRKHNRSTKNAGEMLIIFMDVDKFSGSGELSFYVYLCQKKKIYLNISIYMYK